MRQDDSARPDLVGELRVRFPLPVVLPLVAVIVIAGATFGFSRVLLTIPHEAATTVAIVTAANILIASSFVALRPRMHRVGILEVALIALYPIVVAIVIAYTGIGAEGTAEAEGQGPQEAPPAGNADASLVAAGVAFDTNEITLPAREEVTVTLVNEDSVLHNLAIYESEQDAQAQSDAIFDGDNVEGGETEDYQFEAPPPGDYYFHCDLHPAMNGTVTVE